MKRPNITPGEWRQNSVAVQHDIHDVLSEGEATIAFIPGKGPHRKADGKAITALPELLAALESFVNPVNHHVRGGNYPAVNVSLETLKQAKVALIKAGYTFD